MRISNDLAARICDFALEIRVVLGVDVGIYCSMGDFCTDDSEYVIYYDDDDFAYIIPMFYDGVPVDLDFRSEYIDDFLIDFHLAYQAGKFTRENWESFGNYKFRRLLDGRYEVNLLEENCRTEFAFCEFDDLPEDLRDHLQE